MNSKTALLSLLVLATVACGGRSGARGAAQQQYETVEEGSASGVTSTIHGPGETLPPITGTNADTTTDFALNPNALPPPMPQAQPASTYSPLQPLPPMTSASTVPPPRPVPMPSTAAPEPKPAPAIETTTTPPPPPATTTTVAPAEKPQEDPPPPPADDTDTQAEEPPPPPPPRSAGVLAG